MVSDPSESRRPMSPAKTASLYPGSRWWTYGFVLGMIWMVCSGTPLCAHPSPNTAVLLDFDRAGVKAELILPLPELEIGFGQPLAATPTEVVSKYGPALRDYIRAHVHPTAPDGRPWTVEVQDDLAIRKATQPTAPDDLVAHVWMQPPAGAPLRKFTLNYDVIAHEVNNHRAFVFIRNDWNAAHFATATAQPEAVGMIGFNHHAAAVDRSTGSWWRGFRSVVDSRSAAYRRGY